jgi:hypothetical protein
MFQKMNAHTPLANIFGEAKAWPDSLYSDDLLYLGSRAKAKGRVTNIKPGP